jgi:hypothetical protein
MEFESLNTCPEWDSPITVFEGRTPAEVFNGNQHAFALANSIILLTNIWDDLIDQDKPVTRTQINSAFYCALSEIPQNPFFAQHRGYLQPLMDSMMVSYFCANEWEQAQDPHGMELGHVMRYAPVFFIGAVVNLAHDAIYDGLPIIYKALCGERRGDYIKELTDAVKSV